MSKSFKLNIPASSANIGPGFDVLGIGLNLFLTISASVDSSVDTSSYDSNCHLSYEGDNAQNVPLDASKNLVTNAALYVLRCNGVSLFPIGTRIHVNNPIPLGRGLGSSAAAIVGGIMLGNEIGGFGFDKLRLMDYCLMIERHPDNVAAAMLGGFVGSYLNELSEEDELHKNVPLEYILPKQTTPADKISNIQPPKEIGEYLQYQFNPKVKCVTIIPQFELSTEKARSVLPESYTKPDIIFNLQRLAILTLALAQDPPNHTLIYNSMKDKIHQPYRASLIPGLENVLAGVTPTTDPGLCGICLSGAGPTILCLATDNYEAIAAKVVAIFKESGIECVWKVLGLAYEGATVEHQ